VIFALFFNSLILKLLSNITIKGSKDRIVKIWNLASGFLVASFRGMDQIRAIDVNYENTILAVAADRDIYLYNLINGELLDNLSYPDHHHRKSICCLKVSFYC
jgi:WD40 repeat protein